MKKSKKGFTLVELLISISLLAIVTIIIVFNVKGSTNKTLENQYDQYRKTVMSAVNAYVELNSDAIAELYESKSFIYLKVSDLINEGLISEELLNPITNEPIDQDELVQVYLDTNGLVSFSYPIAELENDIYLKALTVNMTTDDTFTCLRGAGTYALVLYDQDGNWIQLTPEAISRYNVTCSVDSGMNHLGNGVYQPSEPGTYNVLYTYQNAAGIEKSINRVIIAIGRTYTVTLDATGGTVDPSSFFVSENGKYNEHINYLPIPVSNGLGGAGVYNFSRWVYNGSTITSSAPIAVNADHTLTAEWYYQSNRSIECDDPSMTYNSATGKCEHTVSAKSVSTYSCPSGYSLTNESGCYTSTSGGAKQYVCSSNKSGSQCSGTTSNYNMVCSTGTSGSDGRCHSTISTSASSYITYSCPSGYSGGGSSSSCSSSYVNDCSAGYSRSGTTCSKTSYINETVTYSCPSGYTDNGSGCTKTTTTTATCPSGYSQSGSTCQKVSTQSSTPSTSYSCPSGYSINSTNTSCSKNVGNAYYTITGNQCVDDATYSSNHHAYANVESQAILYLQQNGGTSCIIAANYCGTFGSGNNITYSRYVCYYTSSSRSCSTGSVSGSYCYQYATPTSNTTYSCPSGYTLSSDNSKCTRTDTADPSCPSGYSRNGFTCTQVSTQEYTVTRSCASGYSGPSNGQCSKYESYSLGCSSGYTFSNGYCNSTVSGTAITNYYCSDSSYSLSGTTCYKDSVSDKVRSYVCPSGYTGGGSSSTCYTTNINSSSKYICPGDISGLYTADAYSSTPGYINNGGILSICTASKASKTYYYCNDAHSPADVRNVKNNNQISCYIDSIR